MPGTYDRAFTIEEAIKMIGDRDLLIPAIQRKFVWGASANMRLI